MAKYPRGHWKIKKNVIAAARDCSTRSEFLKRYAGAYDAARDGGYFPECVEHMGVKKNGWDVKERITTEEFIRRAREVHGDQYNYDKSVYTGNQEKLTIICPVHGEFEQHPNNHISGKKGCSECAGNVSLTTESFIERAKSEHGDRYDYSLAEYRAAHTKVTIICPKHGKFKQSPHCHMNGQGCRKCGREVAFAKIRKTTEQFIAEATEYHGGYYNYSKVNYVDGDTEVTIICPVHGEFNQTPTNHLRSGCPSCVEYGYNPSKPAYLYVIRFQSEDGSITFTKNGITNNLDQRMGILDNQIVSGITYRIVEKMSRYFEEGDYVAYVEDEIQKVFGDRQFTGLLATDFDGRTELFENSVYDEMVAFVEGIIGE